MVMENPPPPPNRDLTTMTDREIVEETLQLIRHALDKLDAKEAKT
jgi:hypothetical protein